MQRRKESRGADYTSLVVYKSTNPFIQTIKSLSWLWKLPNNSWSDELGLQVFPGFAFLTFFPRPVLYFSPCSSFPKRVYFSVNAKMPLLSSPLDFAYHCVRGPSLQASGPTWCHFTKLSSVTSGSLESWSAVNRASGMVLLPEWNSKVKIRGLVPS